MSTTTASLTITATSTSTLTLTSLPLFLPTELAASSYALPLPGGFAIGGTSSARIDYAASVVAAASSAITYQLDCQAAKELNPFKPVTSFSCPYNGALVTAGPGIFAYTHTAPDMSVACASVVAGVPSGCSSSGQAFSATSTGLVFNEMPLMITAGAEKLPETVTMTVLPGPAASASVSGSSATATTGSGTGEETEGSAVTPTVVSCTSTLGSSTAVAASSTSSVVADTTSEGGTSAPMPMASRTLPTASSTASSSGRQANIASTTKAGAPTANATSGGMATNSRPKGLGIALLTLLLGVALL